jgi:SSS family solute:Na+ symporter
MSPIPTIHGLDWLVFMLVLLATYLCVWWGNQRLTRSKSSDQPSAMETLLMGRQLTLPIFVPTLMATWYGGIFGVTGLSFERGVFNFITQGAFWYATYIIFALVLVRRVRKIPATGLADLAGQMFGSRAQKLTACLAWANLLPIGYVAGLGIFLGTMLGMDWWWASLLGLAVLFSYAMTGGLRAVVFADVVQCVVMVIAVWVLVIVCWQNYGGVSFLQAKLPSGHWDPTGGHAWSELFIWGFIALGTLVDPSFHQRVQAAKDERTARNGILLATLLWFIFDIATTLGGLYARAILPSAEAEGAYLQLGLQELPPGLKGLFLAGILATILSTLDSYLFTAGATLSADALGKTNPWHIKGTMLLTGIIAWLMAPAFGGNIVSVWKTFGGLASSSLLPAILVGLFRPGRLSETGFLWSVGLGVGLNLLHLWTKFAGSIDEFYVGLAGSLAGVAMALMRKPPKLDGHPVKAPSQNTR